MASPVDFARAFAGPDASDEDVVRYLYAVKKSEHEFWYGPNREPQFPTFDVWLAEQEAKLP